MGEPTNDLGGKMLDAELFQYFVDRCGHLLSRQPASNGKPDMLANRQAVIQRRHLSFDTHAALRDCCSICRGNCFILEFDRPRCRLQLAGNAFEERALAGAVRPDETAKPAVDERK